MKKTCHMCKADKPHDSFYKNRRNGDGLQSACKECWSVYQSSDERKKKRRTYTLKSQMSLKRGEYCRSWRMKTKYGITIEQYDEILRLQRNSCAICEKHQSECKNGLYVDHDHISNNVRGLLCRECNSGLGFFKDEEILMEKAIKYLKINKTEKLKIIQGGK